MVNKQNERHILVKRFFEVLGAGAVIIIGVPIALIVGVGYLLYLPFDIVRYHAMPYYRDLGKKYRFFITSSDVVRLYNRNARDGLGMEYCAHNDAEYFIKDGQVLICGWDHEGFRQTDGKWMYWLEDDGSSQITIEEVLETERVKLKPEHRNLNARLLFFYDDITDAEEFEKAKSCPYFYCVFSPDDEI